jgi:methionyl-tRNA synthetase
MKVLIGSAWPYANGPLHVGHLAALLPADVIARYHRAKGDSVYFVSGSDCHGTPVAIRARQEGKSPQEISDFYHNEFCECFARLGFSFDRYGKTSSDEHKAFVRDFHRRMYEREYVYERCAPQAHCERCGMVLSDRFVAGACPRCGEPCRGDQCDACGAVLDADELVGPACSLCGSPVAFRETKQLFIAISKLGSELRAYLDGHGGWRKNAVAFTKKYIDEGLRDRAVTRDLDWGVDVPRDGYGEKKIYIWAENVLGYLSMSKAVAEVRGEDFAELWGGDGNGGNSGSGNSNGGSGNGRRHYYVHGKDNIPFHTIMLPALILANGGAWRLPDEIVSSEYMTLEGRKISTSRNWAIWAKDLADRYDPDAVRHFLIANGPEKRDADFSWREFVRSNNGELVGAWGNFVNRTLAFVSGHFGGAVPEGAASAELLGRISEARPEVGRLIEAGSLKAALGEIFDLVRMGNKYFDAERPWATRASDRAACGSALHACVQAIANIAAMLEPFLPYSSAKIEKWLNVGGEWGEKRVPAGARIPEPELLFKRLDKNTIGSELGRLADG